MVIRNLEQHCRAILFIMERVIIPALLIVFQFQDVETGRFSLNMKNHAMKVIQL